MEPLLPRRHRDGFGHLPSQMPGFAHAAQTATQKAKLKDAICWSTLLQPRRPTSWTRNHGTLDRAGASSPRLPAPRGQEQPADV